MKQKIFCVLVIGFVVLFQYKNIYPQLIKSYGVKIGITTSNIDVKNIKPIKIGLRNITPDYSNLKGHLVSPAITIWGKILNDDLLSLELEASYMQKGSSNTREEFITTSEQPDGTGEKEKITTSLIFKYLQFNINPQVGYRFGEIKTYGLLGPSVNILLGNENFLMREKDRKNILLGYNLGIGISFHKIFLEAKYNGDFSSFYSVGPEFWNKVYMFNFGVEI